MNTSIRFTFPAALTFAAAISFAGTGQLNAHAQADVDSYGSIGSDSQLNISGLGVNSASTIVSIGDPTTGQSAATSQVVISNITGETTGSFEFQDEWAASNGPSTGYMNVNAVSTQQSSFYTFNAVSGGTLDVNFTATSSGFAGGFGFWNPYIIVDGVTYGVAGGTTPPLASGGWSVALSGPGSHTLEAVDFSNVEGGIAGISGSMDAVLNFNVNSVPEPSAALLLCPGIVGLALFRRGRKA